MFYLKIGQFIEKLMIKAFHHETFIYSGLTVGFEIY